MIKINEKTRRISPIGVVNVKSDLKAHRLPFICKDQVTENVKLSECSLWINYTNGGIYDRYAVEDLVVNGDNVTFSWLLGGNATAYNGETQFTILAEQTENGEISLAWNTVLASFKVEDAIEAEYTPRESQQDVFEQLLQMVGGKQDKLTAGTGITIENNVISATGGGGNVDFDETIKQNSQTGKYGIDFSQYNLQEASWANDGKAIKSNDINAWKLLLAQAINASLAEKQDTLENGDITTGLIADNNVTETKLSQEVQQKLNSGGVWSTVALEALMTLLEHVAFTDEHGQEYFEALKNILLPPATLLSISSVFEQGQTVIYDADSLDDLRQYLTVTAHYDDETTETVTNYTLSGTLTEGTSVITVSYGGKTTTFNVTVTHADFIIIQGKSLTWENGYVSNNGAIAGQSTAGAYTSAFFELQNKTQVTVALNGAESLRMAYYNANKGFIKRELTATSSVPTNAVYGRATVLKASLGTGGYNGTGTTITLE